MRGNGTAPKREHFNIIQLATLNREEPKKQIKTKSNSSKFFEGKKQFHVLYFMKEIWNF